MRIIKIAIPLLIAFGISLYIYTYSDTYSEKTNLDISPPTASTPDIAQSASASEIALTSPLANVNEPINGQISPLASPIVITTTQPISSNILPLATTPIATATDSLEKTPLWRYEVVQPYPHDPAAFTQGLIWLDNIFYEGTGLRGRSSLRKVDRDTGAVLKQINLPEQYFGEGITVLGSKLYQLTWQSQAGFIYDKDTFELLTEFSYATEGWGITHNGQQLIMSDGTDTLYIWDPETLAEIGQIHVTDQGQPVVRLNELEYINGQIYANIWQTDRIAIIDPTTGHVTAWLDLAGLLSPADRTGGEDVLNGIAYNAENDTLYITGKLWPKLFEIRPVAPQ